MAIANFLLDRASATLLIFAAFAAIAGIATMKPERWSCAGLIGLSSTACLTISGPVSFRLARLGHRTPIGPRPFADDHVCDFGERRGAVISWCPSFASERRC